LAKSSQPAEASEEHPPATAGSTADPIDTPKTVTANWISPERRRDEYFHFQDGGNVKKKIPPVLVRVVAFKSPGPKWHIVGEPTERAKAAIILAGEWKSGNLARIVPIKKATTASKAS
jgi:hypothetical protein